MKYFFEYHHWIGAVQLWVENDGQPIATEIPHDRRHINVTIGNKRVITINLPCVVDVNTKGEVQRGKLFNVRLNELKSGKTFDRSSNHIMEKLVAKWMRKDLVKHPFVFYCLDCDTPVISSINCKRIRDMPSEFWADFMDYWHCHKPDMEPHQKGHHVAASETLLHRYNNPLNPAVGEIMLSDSFIYINKDWIPEKFIYDEELVRSRSCNTVIGSFTKEGSVRIGKWNLRAEIGGFLDVFDPSNYVLYQIYNELKAHSIRLFHLKGDDKRYIIWVFGIGSCIQFDKSRMLNNCLKILYRDGKPAESEKNQNIAELKVEENSTLINFIQHLESVNRQLPEELRLLNEWKVSYISCE